MKRLSIVLIAFMSILAVGCSKESKSSVTTAAADMEIKEEALDLGTTETSERIPSSRTVPEETDTKLIVIDPGHQREGNSEQEPIGPGAEKTKAKVTGGATGVVTGQFEYELNLQVSLQLKEELVSHGYDVILVRETNEVDISNQERAQIANKANADAFIRIHANGSENSNVNGVMVIAPTKDNPYISVLYEQCNKLASSILENIVSKTGARSEGIMETDTMSGINWSEVPVIIIEMGYLSNPEEDKLLADKTYQRKIVWGISSGLDEFFQAEDDSTGQSK